MMSPKLFRKRMNSEKYNTSNINLVRVRGTPLAIAQLPFSEKLSLPRKPKNLDVRGREYLLSNEVEAMMTAAAKTGRHGQRDRTLILLMYRHGFRVCEVACLRWHQIDLVQAHIHIHRRKRGKPSVHPLYGDEIRALRQLRGNSLKSPWVFQSERQTHLSERGIHQIIARAGEQALLDFPVHPHMLRHGCGFFLASKGYDTRVIQDYLGHRNINHTVRYTELAPGRFEGLWEAT